jgi:hypothetical protein
MEVSETAACGIAQREFAIACDPDELADLYRALRYTLSGTGFYNVDFLDDLKSQLVYIVGPSVEDEPEDDVNPKMSWEDDGNEYTLSFQEEAAGIFYRLLEAVDSPGEGIYSELNQNLLDQMMEMAPSTLDGLPVINR